MANILDLSNSNSQTATFSIQRNATFDNTVDFYQVNANGSVIDPETGVTIAPGEEGYTEAAIANRLELNLSTTNGETTEFSAELAGGAFYAPMIAVNDDFSSFSDGDSSNDPKIYFTYEAANIDGFDHVNSSAENQFGFEDLLNGGDKDFNDLIVDVELNDSGNPPPQSDNGTISGVKFNDRNNNGERDNIVEGDNPDAVFVIDASYSAVFPFVGDALQDVNNDAEASTEAAAIFLNNSNVTEERRNILLDASPNNPNILDAQLSAFIALNQQLETQGLGDDAEVGIVVFAQNAVPVDLDPSSAGLQLTTTPNADNNNNGTPDVEEVLRSITFDTFGVDSSGTDFEAALQEAENVFNSLGTEPDEGNLIFLSDGFPEESGFYEDEVARLNDLEVNITAFGVGEGASLEDLRNIDSGADIFTSIDEVIDIFGDLNSNGSGGINGGSSQNQLEPGVSGVSIYLDLNNNGTLDDNEPTQVTDDNGQYVFEGLAAGTYTVRELVPEGSTQTLPADGQYTFELGEGEIVENIDFGNFEEIAMMEVEATEI